VTGVGRFAAALGAVALLACGSLAAAGLATGARSAATTTTATTTAATTTTVESEASTVLAFTGHGWGHGLGMSQWGAYGYAMHGWTFNRILAHYYTGTTLGTAKVKTVRVLVASKKKTTLASPIPWTVTDAAGTKTPLDPGSLGLGPGLKTEPLDTLQPPLTFSATQPLTVDGRGYHGKLTVSSDGKQLTVVNTVGLEQYLKGVVPAEMPSKWPPEALKAQAVAARSYALANLAKAKAYDLYGDTRDQVYGGIAAESPQASAAVDATRAQVVLYGGKVANTLFFSTSGGRTVSALESIGVPVPYLVSVDDPYDVLSPYHDWGPQLFDAGQVAKQLKLPGPVADVRTVDGPSGRVKSLSLVSADDSTVTVTGNQVRTVLGLRSSWFTPAFLQLLPAKKTMTYGGAVKLTGEVHGADGLSLEAKPTGLGWTAAGAVTLDADNAFSTSVKPQVSTWYRLVWGDARVGLAKISVAARVTATLGASGVQGSVRPAAAGAPVQLQQKQADGSWLTTSSATTDAASNFVFAGGLAAGTYRVRAVPGRGVIAGVSASLVAS
jgi:stage II sporulation protein D